MTAGHPTGLVVVLPTGYRRSRSIRSGVDAVVRDPEKASSLSRRSPTLMFLAVVLAALIMLAKASCWAFTMVSANSDQDLKTCFQASSTGAKASKPAESARGCSRREPCSVYPSCCLRSSRLSPNSRSPRLSRRSRDRRGSRGSRRGRCPARPARRSGSRGVRCCRRPGSVLVPLVLRVERASAVGVQRGRGRRCVELPWTAGIVRAIALPHGEDQCSAHCRGGPASWIRRSILRYPVHDRRR